MQIKVADEIAHGQKKTKNAGSTPDLHSVTVDVGSINGSLRLAGSRSLFRSKRC